MKKNKKFGNNNNLFSDQTDPDKRDYYKQIPLYIKQERANSTNSTNNNNNY